jgi:hypothetical protein
MKNHAGRHCSVAFHDVQVLIKIICSLTCQSLSIWFACLYRTAQVLKLNNDIVLESPDIVIRWLVLVIRGPVERVYIAAEMGRLSLSIFAFWSFLHDAVHTLSAQVSRTMNIKHYRRKGKVSSSPESRQMCGIPPRIPVCLCLLLSQHTYPLYLWGGGDNIL